MAQALAAQLPGAAPWKVMDSRHKSSQHRGVPPAGVWGQLSGATKAVFTERPSGGTSIGSCRMASAISNAAGSWISSTCVQKYPVVGSSTVARHLLRPVVTGCCLLRHAVSTAQT